MQQPGTFSIEPAVKAVTDPSQEAKKAHQKVKDWDDSFLVAQVRKATYGVIDPLARNSAEFEGSPDRVDEVEALYEELCWRYEQKTAARTRSGSSS